jgi:hypothetical protein
MSPYRMGTVAVRTALLQACALLLTGCDSLTIPGRLDADVYDFELQTNPPAILRWPSGTVVRVFVATGGGDTRDRLLLESFARGAAGWNALARFGEFHLARTADASNADVVLTWSDVPVVDAADCPPAVTRGVTTFCLEGLAGDPPRLRTFPLLPPATSSRVKMLVTLLATEAAVPDRARRIVAHELGHVLGLTQHSPNQLDLMWRTDPSAERPSVRDAATLQVLYHLRPDVLP